jgi:peptide/nickel transport system substrate-binding protein
VVTAVAAATALAALTGCTGQTGSTASKDQLTLGMTADISGWDPAVQPSFQGWAAMAVWDQLFRCDAHGQPQPDIAKSFDFASDNKTLTVHIRPGMKFTDGEPVDAKAVKTALEYMASQANSRLAGLTIETPEPLTAVATLPKPTATFKLLMCYQSIPSPKSVEAGAASKTWSSPVGSGPYILDKSATTAGSVYTFTKNDAYWDSKTFPYKKLVLKVLKSDTAAVNALKTGQIDGTLVSSTTLNEAKSSANVDILTLKAPNTTRLLITDHLGKIVPALGNVDVRRAMNMVFDRESIAKNLYQGHAAPANQIFRPGSDAYISDLGDPYPYDVAKAKELMAKAGYAGGFTLQIPVIENGGNGIDLMLPYVTQQLALLNIKVDPVTLSGPNMYAELLGGKYPVPLWQLGNYGESLQDIQDYIQQEGIWNVEHQPDATIEKLWAQITAGKDVKQAEQEINKYVTDQAWFVPMVYADNFYAHNSSVTIKESTDLASLQPMLWDFK